MAYPESNYTQIPNLLLDEQMRDMGEAELKVVLCAARKIMGYHKQCDGISLTQFEEMTGLSRQGVIDGIARAVERGVLIEVGTGKRGVKLYELHITSSQASRPVKQVDQSTELTSSSQASRPVLVKQVDTQKKGKKIEKKDSTAKADTDSSIPKWNYQDAFEVVASNSFGVKESIPQTLGKRIGSVVKTLSEFENPPTAAELKQFYRWRGRVHNDIQYLKSSAALQLAIVEWRKTQEYRHFVTIVDIPPTPPLAPLPQAPVVETVYAMADIERMFNELSEKTK